LPKICYTSCTMPGTSVVDVVHDVTMLVESGDDHRCDSRDLPTRLKQRAYSADPASPATPAAEPQYSSHGDGSSATSPASPMIPLPSFALSSATSGRWFAQAKQTLIFLDWDDTLFPTTELFHRWGLPSRSEEWATLALTPAQQQQIILWEDAVYQMLCVACGKSNRLSIVTNAKRPWVTDCIDRFAPRLKTLVERCSGGLNIVYAREAHADSRQYKDIARAPSPARYSAGDATSPEEQEAVLTAWKFTAMQQEAIAFYTQYPGQTWKNILSMGDAPYEHHALQEVAFLRVGPDRECLRTKSIIAASQQSISFMTLFLKLGAVLFPLYVAFDGDFTLDMSRPGDRREEHVRVFGIPDLWVEGTRADLISNADASAPVALPDDDSMLDEIAIVVQDALDTYY